MDKLKITGGGPLQGKVRISGAKNSALPAMAACLLTADELRLENLPMVNDILTTRRLLKELGADVEFSGRSSAIRVAGSSHRFRRGWRPPIWDGPRSERRMPLAWE